MKRLISALLCVILLASCTPAVIDKPASSADGVAKYTAFLEERLEKMPEELTIATAETADTYGVDMSDFADDGYLIRAEAGEVLILGKTDAGLDRAVREYVKNGNDQDFFKVYNEGYRVKKLTIAGNDISEYAIVRDDDADECQTYASSVLADYVAKATGITLPQYISSEYASAADKPAYTIRLTVDYPALGDEAFTITVGGDGNMTISGGRYRGCMYGVYDVLEDIGWRFLADPVENTLEFLYESEHIDLTAEINRTESPAIAFRRIHGGHNNNETASKFRMNSIWSAQFGGYGLTDIACHGLQNQYSQIFTGEYEDVYAGLESEAKQPCFTNEYVLEAIDSFVIRFVESALSSGQTIGKELVTIDLSQYDTTEAAFCTCKDCMKVFKEEGCTMGAVLRMGNRAAQLLCDNGYGGVNVALLAYSGTERPPKKTVPLDNVRISYCIYVASSYFACSNHSVDGKMCDPASFNRNTEVAKEFEKWSSICKNNNLDIWYYPFNCYGVAFDSPIYESIYDSMVYLTSGSVNGMMFHSNLSSGVNLHSLISYLGGKLMWDSSISREEYHALIREWFSIVYGDAWENVYECFRMIQNAGSMSGCWSAFHSPNSDKVNHAYIADHFDQIYTLMNEARELADTTSQQNFVEMYYAGMLYICIGITHTDRYLNGTEAQRAEFAERYQLAYDIFKKHNLRVYFNFFDSEYVPEVLDLETNPFDSWCTKWGN